MVLHLVVPCVITTLVVVSHLRAAGDAVRIGVYHWGGERTRSMAEGVRQIASLGGTVARVAYSPRYPSDYNVGTECYENFSLTRLAQETDVESALSDERIRVLILTTYDGVTFGDCHTHRYLNPEFYSPGNIEALKAEYREFVVYLFQRYAGSGRRVVISNWEGDNAIYCGAAHRYATEESFRKECDANYSLLYDGNAGPEQSLEGMKLWLLIRQEAIEEGIAEAHARGWSGLDVVHAPEISIVRSLEERGLRSVLRDILPALRPEYVSYSAYESINRDDPARALAVDVATVRLQSGASHIIIGEAGYSRKRWGSAGTDRLHAVIEQALELGVAYLICWNLQDQGPDADYGLFDDAGELTAVGRLVEKVLRAEGGRRLRQD
jgi:hypothetical protein